MNFLIEDLVTEINKLCSPIEESIK